MHSATRVLLLIIVLISGFPQPAAGKEPPDEPRALRFEPARGPWPPYEFRLYPIVGFEKDGGRWIRLHATIKGERRIGLKSIEIVLPGRSTALPFARREVDVDSKGCLVAESVELGGQERLAREVATATEVSVRFIGEKEVRERRLAPEDLLEFQRLLGIYEQDPGSRIASEETPPSAPGPDPGAAQSPRGDAAGSGSSLSLQSRNIANPVLVGRYGPPHYPQIARKKRKEGEVTLQAVIGKDGRVGEVKVLRSTTPDCGFEEAAIDAVKSWRYAPGMVDGEPVEVYFTIPVEFSLPRR